MSARKKRKNKKNPARRIALLVGFVLLAGAALYAALGFWFVHHPRAWLADARESWPNWVSSALLWVGNPVEDIANGVGLTGHDTVYEFDEQAPAGSVFFAGAPKRVSGPAPTDIQILNRGEFAVGWSPSLRHPVWCAYHVIPRQTYVIDRRPNFQKDRSAPGAPAANAYERSGYDRGHMVPNFAMSSRYGEDEQKKTFLTSNITPQTPALNRGVWRDIEHHIAELWTARYGEIWVIVGCFSSGRCGRQTISGSEVEVPESFYQVVLAQEGLDVRALAIVYDQTVAWNEWPTRGIVTIDELEEMTGLDFLPDLPEFIQSPLEAELPTRLWPVRFFDIFKQIGFRFRD